MNLKTKIKSYSFWVSLASAVILILKLIGQRFGFDVDEGLISDLFTSLCAILVILGIIVVPSANSIIEQKSINVAKDLVEEKQPVVCEKLNNIAEENKVNVITEKTEELAHIENDNKEFEIVVEKNDDIQSCTKNAANIDNRVDSELKNQNFDNSTFCFNLESFIDKVCSKRAELNNNVLKFSEFLQNELENIKKCDN